MINFNEVNETIQMLDNQHLDVRTVTMGISLYDCADSDKNNACKRIYDKICFKAENLVSECEKIENIAAEDQKAVLAKYATVFDVNHTKDEWFATMKSICEELGFSPDVKAYKADPSAFKGHVGDVSTVIRIALTSRRNTPDLYSIMNLLGEDEIKARLNAAIDSWK